MRACQLLGQRPRERPVENAPDLGRGEEILHGRLERSAQDAGGDAGGKDGRPTDRIGDGRPWTRLRRPGVPSPYTIAEAPDAAHHPIGRERSGTAREPDPASARSGRASPLRLERVDAAVEAEPDRRQSELLEQVLRLAKQLCQAGFAVEQVGCEQPPGVVVCRPARPARPESQRERGVARKRRELEEHHLVQLAIEVDFHHPSVAEGICPPFDAFGQLKIRRVTGAVL